MKLTTNCMNEYTFNDSIPLVWPILAAFKCGQEKKK